MDPKKSQAQQKRAALKAYIEKQLRNGVNPKELYQHLVGKNVPSKVAADLINQSISNLKKPTASAAGPDPTITERQQKILKFIKSQLGVGKSKQEILKFLMEKKISKEEGISLIHQAASTAKQPQTKAQNPAAVSTEMPQNLLTMTPDSKISVAEVVYDQLAQGVDMKEIVNQLVEGGMPRNTAIDLVVEINQAGLNEQAGIPSRDLARQATRGRNKMLIGIAALVGGGLLSAASYAAADIGEEYIILTGPMIFGAIYAVVGLIEWLRNM
jgi:hypothetical protein